MGKILAIRKEPVLRPPHGYPEWFHDGGATMRLATTEEYPLIIRNNAACVTIMHLGLKEENILRFNWEIRLTRGKIIGYVNFTADELKMAAGLTNGSGRYGQWLIEKFGGDSAEQGLFIRWINCLNVPGPGIGLDDDTKVSIFLTPEIKKAIRQLMA